MAEDDDAGAGRRQYGKTEPGEGNMYVMGGWMRTVQV